MAKSPDYISALVFAPISMSTQLQARMHMAAGTSVQIMASIPVFDVGKIEDIFNQSNPKVIIIDASVDGYSLHDFLKLRMLAEKPLILVGIAEPNSPELDDMFRSNLDAVFPLPLTEDSYERLLIDLPIKYASVADGWGKGAWSKAVPDAIRAAVSSSAVTGVGWQKQAIAIWSPKGGVGKTTISIEVASALAVVGGRSVVLIDANMNGGHVRYRLNIKSQNNILTAAAMYQTLKKSPTFDKEMSTAMHKYLTPVSNNIDFKILQGVNGLRDARNRAVAAQNGQEFIEYVIRHLRKVYDFVIVDLGSSVNVGVHLGVLHSVDKILAIATPDSTSLADIKMGVHKSLIPMLGCDIDRFSLVLNNWQDGLGHTLENAASWTSMGAVGIIPLDTSSSVTLAGNEGESFVARYAQSEDNILAVEKTLNGFITLAAQFYPPIGAAWSERSKKLNPKDPEKRGLLDRVKKTLKK